MLWQLLSDEEPLLAMVAQRLSSFSEREGTLEILVPSASKPLSALLTSLGIAADRDAFAFETLPGIHRIPCGSIILLLHRTASAAPWRETDTAPDLIFALGTEKTGALRGLMKENTMLVFHQNPLKIAPVFEEKEDGFCLSRVSKRDKSTFVKRSDEVLVVGGGLAGAMTAYALSVRGRRVRLIDEGCVPGSGASALYAGLIHPHWQASDSPLFQLTRAGFEAMIPLLQTFPAAFQPVGVLDAASSEAEYERWEKAVREGCPHPMPEDFAKLVSKDEAQVLAGLSLSRGGWWFPRAGLVHAGMLCRLLAEKSGASILTGTRVKLRRDTGGWCAVNAGGTVVGQAPTAVVCAALGTAQVLDIPRDWLGMSGLYGRISLLRDTDLPTLKTALTGDGYAARTPDGFCAVGATYEVGESPLVSEAEAHAHNLSTFPKLLNESVETIARGFYEGVRAVAQDRMPLAGRGFTRAEIDGLKYRGIPEVDAIPRAENLWICAGLGSRGITWGLAAAQYVTAGICEETPALKKSLIAGMDPARFMPKLLGC